MKQVARNTTYTLGLCVLSGFFLYGIMGDPVKINLPATLTPPSPDFPFGADHLGRDLLARIVHGFLYDLFLGLSVVFFSAAFGILAGITAGYCEGGIDACLLFVMDLLTSLPHLILAMVIMVYMSYSTEAMIFSLVLCGWVKYARISRTQTCSLRKQDYIHCEEVLGAGTFFILSRHIFPNVIPAIVGLTALHFGHVILSIAALGFLGLGLQPPTPEWGTMILEARPYMMRASWPVILPGLCIFSVVAFFSILGRYLNQRFNSQGDSHVIY